MAEQHKCIHEKDWGIMETAVTNLDKKIDEKFTVVFNKLDMTNGRLTTLEKWRNRMAGGLAVLTLIIVPVVIFFLKNWNLVK